MNRVHLIDCEEFMKGCKDNQFDLAIVDPEYGGNDAIGLKDCKNKSKQATARTEYKVFANVEPDKEYWNKLFRISRNQIVWGCNFYTKVNLHGGRLVWDKKGTAFGRAEEAYLSMTKSVNIFEYAWNGMIQEKMHNKEKRIHVCQKPVDLYKWLLQNYAKPKTECESCKGKGNGNCKVCEYGPAEKYNPDACSSCICKECNGSGKRNFKIFDSHVGSGSIRIACHDLGFDFEGCELDPDYHAAQEKRYQNHIQQSELFGKEEIQGLVFRGDK